MTHGNKNIKIVAFVGLAGSGKTTATEYLAQHGIPKVYGGGIFYEEMRRSGLELNPENENKFRHQIRNDKGQNHLVEKFIGQINDLVNAGQHRIVTDSNYSWDEYKAMKHEFPGELHVVALLAPKHIRHHRLHNRDERPLNEAEAGQRDWREIEDLNVGATIALADHYIINDGTIEEMYQKIDRILNNIEFFN